MNTKLSPSSASNGAFSLASPRLTSRSAYRSNEPLGYSAGFVDHLEKKHESSLIDVYDRLRSQEESHERTSESLRKQVASLRLQLDYTTQQHTRELHQIREEFEEKLVQIARDQQLTEQAHQGKVRELQFALEKERATSKEHRQDSSISRAKLIEETSRLQNQLRLLQHEHEQALRSSASISKHELDRLDQERTYLKNERLVHYEELRSQAEAQVLELRFRLESKDTLIASMEQELTEVKRSLHSKAEAAGRDVQTLQETLKSSRKVIEVQENDLDRLKKEREDFRRDSRILSKEAAMLENELAKTRRENVELKEQVNKFEKIVYGRSSKKTKDAK